MSVIYETIETSIYLMENALSELELIEGDEDLSALDAEYRRLLDINRRVSLMVAAMVYRGACK